MKGVHMHELEMNDDGTARFAYSATGGAPWHRLGTPMKGLGTLDEMLTAAQADYTVHLVKVAAVDENGNLLLDPDGKPIIIDDSRATVREDVDGTWGGLATVGTRYTVKQNREVAERALAVVGATKGDAVIDTAGVLFDGRQFFMTIDLGPLVIDPVGVNDRISRYLVVTSGHDGKVAIKYANTDIRAVCNNTVRLAMHQAQSTFTARHTKNVDTALEDAQTVLEISTEWAKGFKQMAESLLAVPVRTGTGEIDKVLNKVFPVRADETDRQKNNREEVNTLIRGIFDNSRNAGGYGYNGWSMVNAIGEYLDHHRAAMPAERAVASMDDNSWVSRKKIEAQRAVLSLV